MHHRIIILSFSTISHHFWIAIIIIFVNSSLHSSFFSSSNAISYTTLSCCKLYLFLWVFLVLNKVASSWINSIATFSFALLTSDRIISSLRSSSRSYLAITFRLILYLNWATFISNIALIFTAKFIRIRTMFSFVINNVIVFLLFMLNTIKRIVFFLFLFDLIIFLILYF